MKKEYLILLAAGCVAASAANVNYDLLGRKGSKMNSPMVFKDVDYANPQKKEKQKLAPSLEDRTLAKRASGIKSGAKAIVGKFGPEGYKFTNCSNITAGCGEKLSFYANTMSLSSYRQKVNSNFINVTQDGRALEPEASAEIPNYVSAGRTRSGASGFSMTELSYTFSTNPVHVATFDERKDDPVLIKSAHYSDVKSSLGRQLVNEKYGSATNVGVYLAEEALPTRLNPRDGSAPFILAENASMSDFKTQPGFEMRASRMYKALKRFSQRSVVYAKNNRPSNPAAANPQIYMGLQAYGGSPVTKYSGSAKKLDNYIYDNRTVEILGAGNSFGKSTGDLSGDAYAVNAITVGALDPFTDQPTPYSANNKTKYGDGDWSCKPEMYNYSNFHINDYLRTYTSSKTSYNILPYYDGTEASAAITAGMVSDMLSVNEFYRWHPEVVKAVALNGTYNTHSKVPMYNHFVFDQKDVNNIHHSYYFIGDVNTLMKEYDDYDCPNSDIGCGKGKKEIRLVFDKYDLVGMFYQDDLDGFVASIAWLNSGNDVYNLGKLPQNFEMEIYHQPAGSTLVSYGAKRDATSLSWSAQDMPPFKSVTTYGYERATHPVDFTLRIVLTDEDTRSENYGQMVLGLDIKPIFKTKQR